MTLSSTPTAAWTRGNCGRSPGSDRTTGATRPTCSSRSGRKQAQIGPPRRLRSPSGLDDQVNGLGPRVLDVRPRGVEVSVVRDVLAGTAKQLEWDAPARPSLVGGQNVLYS